MKCLQPLVGVALILFFHTSNAETLIENQVASHSTYLIGTYANAKNQGIELLNFDQDNKLVSSKLIADEIKAPTFLTANRDRTLIFAVESSVNGKIRSFSYHQLTQQLVPLAVIDSFGENPCYLALDNSERFLAVANYDSGNFSIYEVTRDGNLYFKQSIQHHGNSIYKPRQNSTHVHSMLFHPNGKQLLVADLGTDKIHIYDVNFTNAMPITQANPAYFKVAAGSGPRHMILHPNGKLLYLVHELTAEVGIYSYESGKISHVNTHTLVTPPFIGNVQAAEIRISSDGKFIYVSNRGDANNLTVFEVDSEGNLKLVQQISTDGLTPRNFNLSPDGHFLLAANQDSNDISLFKRDPITGRLSKTSTKIEIQKPAYIFSLF